MRHLFITFCVCLLASVMCHAHDFSTEVNGQTLHFNISSKSRKTVSVTYPGSIKDKKTGKLIGTVEIPAKVKYDDVFYSVTAIAPKAFAGEKMLKGIVIPSGVASIGDFAFEGCDSLSSVIFPGNPVEFGQGVFFLDTAIANVTIGSDWKSVDFTMFRWSDLLESIMIPAKIDKIQGVKKLKKLKDITVDPNNRSFSSAEGILYSKDGKNLLVCPRAKEGNVNIMVGTENILEGALSDCTSITAIEFPESLKSVSFRQTARMEALTSVTLRNETPVTTGYLDGNGYFLFQLYNPSNVTINVPAKAKDTYCNALAT